MLTGTDAFAAVTGAFLTLASIANPIGSVFVFDQASSALTPSEQRLLARRIAIASALILIAAILAGTLLLKALGISLAVLQVAGGLVLGWHAWWMVVGEPSSIALKDTALTSKMDVLVPLTVPLTVGPGTIAAAIALGSPVAPNPQTFSSVVFVIAAALMLAAAIDVLYGHARRITTLFGEAGALAAQRSSAFILLCVAIQIVLRGLRDAVLIT